MAAFDFVYFDLDDTLLDHRAAERGGLRSAKSLFEALGDVSPEELEETYHEINVALWGDYAAGKIDRDTLGVRRFADLLSALGVRGIDPADLATTYMSAYAEHWSPIEDAVAALEDVSRIARTGIITNGFAEVQHAKLARFPRIRACVEAVVISEEVGFLKPDRRLFSAAERAAQCDGAILYVGDSFRSDVVGALESGWSVAWFRGAGVDAAQRLADERRMGDAVRASGAAGTAFLFSSWDTLRRELGA